MILTALMECYDLLKKRYEDEPNNRVPEFGFSRETFSKTRYVNGKKAVDPDFCVILNKEGKILQIREIEPDTVLILPSTTKSTTRTRDASDNPYFLWDKTDYVFGARSKAKDKKAYFQSFKELIQKMALLIDDEGMQAVSMFFKSWSLEDVENNPKVAEKWPRMKGKKIVFQLYGDYSYIPQRSAIIEAWKKHIREIEIEDNRPVKNKKKKPPVEGVSLITGIEKKAKPGNFPIAQKHRNITKCGRNALVGFNNTAFESYGNKDNQAFNAPIGIDEAFKYATALNYLLEDNPNKFKVYLGGISTVFWAERAIETKEGLSTEETVKHNLRSPIYPGEKASNEEKKIYAKLTDKIKSFNEGLKKGRETYKPNEVKQDRSKFYILGLEATSQGRSSVRFWHQTTIFELYENLAKHLKDIGIKAEGLNSPSIYDIVSQLRHEKEDKNKFHKRTSTIATDLAMSVLTGRLYPNELLWGIIDRIRKDGDVNFIKDFTRVSILKGILVRNGYLKREQQRSNLTKEALMALDKNCKTPAYLLGRLFAALEKAQQDAIGSDINRTIKDGFFTSASTNPGVVFPSLIQKAQHHFSKVNYSKPSENGVYRRNMEKLTCDILDMFTCEGFPKTLNLEEQGLFAIAYCHQLSDFFKISCEKCGLRFSSWQAREKIEEEAKEGYRIIECPNPECKASIEVKKPKTKDETKTNEEE